jgi:membrane protease YdiL (CAAX protease family)
MTVPSIPQSEAPPPPVPEPPVPGAHDLKPHDLKPWGYLATLGWALLAMAVSIAATLLIVIAWQRGALEDAPAMTMGGPLFAIVSTITTVVQTAVLFLAAHLRRWRPIDYLGLVWARRIDVVMAVWITVVFVLGYDALTYVLGRDVVTGFQVETYQNAAQAGIGGLALLWFAFVVVAPAGEEIMFRGFLFRGWAASPRAIWPAILLTSAAWSLMHIQYDWFGILQIFLGGILLGWIRWRTGSTLLTIALHALTNVWATLETAAAVSWFSP